MEIKVIYSIFYQAMDLAAGNIILKEFLYKITLIIDAKVCVYLCYRKWLDGTAFGIPLGMEVADNLD